MNHSVLDEMEQVIGSETCTWKGKVCKIEGKNDDKWQLTVRLTDCNDESLKGNEKILLNYYSNLEEPWQLLNHNISFSAELKEPAKRQNPNCFDYNLYLKSQGIEKTATLKHYDIGLSELSPYEKLECYLIKQRFQFNNTLSPHAAGLVNGVLFGDTSALSEDVYDAFRNNGTAHVLAVSGLHIGILYGIYKKIVGRRKSKLAVIILGTCIFCYGTVSLWTPSVFRASVMIGLKILAEALDLRYDPLTGLSTVALILIAINPYVIFGAGFQMSFLAILSISFLVPVMPPKVPDFMTGSLAVNLGLLFFQMYQFNYISLVSLLVNLPVIYLTGILVPVSLVGFVGFALTGTTGPWTLVLDSLSWLITEINEFSTLNGHGSLDVISPPLWLAAIVMFLMFFLSSETFYVLRYRKEYFRLAKYMLTAVTAIAVLSISAYCHVSDCDMVFVDVGQGDCIHLRVGRKNILIDGGGNSNYNVGKNILKPYLLKNGIASVDLAIATHEHMDHYQGIKDLAETYPVKQVKTGLIKGNSINVSERVMIETLWPLEIDPVRGQEENYDCSVFMIHYGKWKVLVTGDLDEKGELEMLEYYENEGKADKLKAHILKAGHHGSHTSTCDAFLDSVNPSVVVIQVGEGNLYGHPHDIVIEKCLKKGIIVLRNDVHGAVGFRFKKDRYQIHTVIS